MFKRILWATDFSEQATRSRDWAVHCAQCSQGKLFALTVADVSDAPVLSAVAVPDFSQASLAGAEQWAEAELTEAVRQRLAQEVAQIQQAGVEAEPVVRIGVPWREIVAAAEGLHVDMIVMGAHGKRGLRALMLGNTTDNVTRRAPCPVMIIR